MRINAHPALLDHSVLQQVYFNQMGFVKRGIIVKMDQNQALKRYAQKDTFVMKEVLRPPLAQLAHIILWRVEKAKHTALIVPEVHIVKNLANSR